MSDSLKTAFDSCVDKCASITLPQYYGGCQATNMTSATLDYSSFFYCSCNLDTGALWPDIESSEGNYEICVQNNTQGACTDENAKYNITRLFTSIRSYCNCSSRTNESHTSVSLPALPACLSTAASASKSLCTNNNATVDTIARSCISQSGPAPNTGAIAGGAVAGVVVFAALIALAYIFFLRKRRPSISSNAIEIINATEATTNQIEAGLNYLATEIKSIATQVSASDLDPSRAASFIKAVQHGQRGHVQIEQRETQLVLAPTKVDATQALQASIAMILCTRVLPYGNPPMHHPLFDEKLQWGEFEQWVAGQPTFAGHKNLSGNRRRQWIAKYVKENMESNARLMDKRQEIVTDTIKDIETVVGKLYDDWEDQSMYDKINSLIETALDLTIDMLGLDLPIIAIWMHPGELFSERYMEMTDISKLGGVVALCIFPRWADSENFTIVKAKVYV